MSRRPETRTQAIKVPNARRQRGARSMRRAISSPIRRSSRRRIAVNAAGTSSPGCSKTASFSWGRK